MARTTMNRAAARTPIEMIRLDQPSVRLPYVSVCPRCSVHTELIFGLKKTPPVCMDCATDDTWTNPQENWSEDGVIVHQAREFQGALGQSRIIVHHPKYIVLEQCHDKELLLLFNYSGDVFHLSRHNVVKSQTSEVHPDNAPECHVKKRSPLLAALLLSNEEPEQRPLTFSKKHSEAPGAAVGKLHGAQKTTGGGQNPPRAQKPPSYHANTSGSLHANAATSDHMTSPKDQQQQTANQTRVSQPGVCHPRAMADSSMTKDNDSRQAHDKNWTFQDCPGFHNLRRRKPHKANANQTGVERRNMQQVHRVPSSGTCCCDSVHLSNQCCVQTCGTNRRPNQDISQIQGHSVIVCNPNRPFWVAKDNVRQTESANRSGCHTNSFFYSDSDKRDALPATSTELNQQLCANDWPQNNILPTEAEIPNRKQPENWHQTNTLALEDPTFCGLQSTNTTCSMTAQEKQMDIETLVKQNLEYWNAIQHYCSEIANLQTLPQLATSTEQESSAKETVDKSATTESRAQMDAAKPSNKEMGSLYPFSIFNSDVFITTSSAAQAKPREDEIDMMHPMPRQENCAQMEAANVSPRTKSIPTSMEQVESSEPKIKITSIMTSQENYNRVETAKSNDNNIGTKHLWPTTSASHVETGQKAGIFTDEAVSRVTLPQIKEEEEPEELTTTDTLPEFETIEDLMKAFSIATTSAAEKEEGSGREEPRMGRVYPQIANIEFNFHLKCPQSQDAREDDRADIGSKLIRTDESKALKEQEVFNKGGEVQLEQSLQKPRIQKAKRKQLKRRLERLRNDEECAGIGRKQSEENESGVKERKSLNCRKTTPESKAQGIDIIGSNECTKSSVNDATASAASPSEAKKQKTGKNLRQDVGVVVDRTNERTRCRLRGLKCGGKFEAEVPSELHPKSNDATETKSKDQIKRQRGRVIMWRKLKVQLTDIVDKTGELFEKALGESEERGVASQSDSSYASKIVDLLVRQHEDWQDWSLEIDSESGLVLRNGKSITSAESTPVDVNRTISTENVHRRKSPRRLKVSQGKTKLLLNKVCPVMEDLAPFHHGGNTKSMLENFRPILTISKNKSHRNFKTKLELLKMAPCHVQKMYFMESDDQEKDGATYSLKLKGVQKTSSSSKDYKAWIHSEQVPITKERPRPHQQC